MFLHLHTPQINLPGTLPPSDMQSVSASGQKSLQHQAWQISQLHAIFTMTFISRKKH